MKILVMTSDKNLHLLRGFAFCFQRHFSKHQPVTVAGFQPPKSLPPQFSFYQIQPIEVSARFWSNCLIHALRALESETVLLMLEDYWLNVQASLGTIMGLEQHVRAHHDILRIDLSNDRRSKSHIKVECYGSIQLISTPPPSQYRMSFQAALWRVDRLLEVLKPGESPWDAEIKGTVRLNRRPELRVLGTLVRPLSYVPVWRTHKQRFENLSRLDPVDLQIMQRKGWVW